MSFDLKSFFEVKFEPRTMDYPVPQLKAWFAKDEKPTWKICGIDGAAIGRADEAAGNENLTAQLFDSLLAANTPEIVAKVKEMVGRSVDKPKAIAKRIYHLQYGTPEQFESESGEKVGCSLDLAVRVCDNFPILFIELTNAILNLSGQGMQPVKLKASGKIQKSK
jgi:hypothetical protein